MTGASPLELGSEAWSECEEGGEHQGCPITFSKQPAPLRCSCFL